VKRLDKKEIDLEKLEKSIRNIVRRMNIEDIVRRAIEHYDPPTLNGIVALDLKTGEVFSYSSLENPTFSNTIVTLYVLPVSRFPLDRLFFEKDLNLAKMLLGDSWNFSARDIASALGKDFKEIEDKMFEIIMDEDSPEEKIIENVLNYVRKVVSL